MANCEFKIHYSTGKNSLFNVLNAMSHYDRELDYIQSMNFIAAHMLEEISEENTFYLMIYVMETLKWREVLMLDKGLLDTIIKNLEAKLKKLNK